MSVSIPQPFRARVEGPIGPVSFSGIPNSFSLKILDPIPKVTAALDALTTDSKVRIDPLTTDSTVRIDPLTTNSSVRVEPLDIGLSLDKIPDIRAHLPAHFSLCLRVLGVPLLSISLGGEAQVITEPYRPGPCERCG
ncbi:hypothetical protein [Solirubrobacter soli]|uniref:hypothetical protein n=1 Tax=Solirubrobacter soli TaxID=363832 RepID=UPI0004179091|nr:hypothetical protein [Solirubrobacter soli]